MADISTRMSVSGISQYKSAMRDAKQSVKTLDQELKRSEAQLKLTGDQEGFMADKAKILHNKLEEQKKVCEQADAALKTMADQGVSKTSTAYQQMQQQLYQAQTAMMETMTQMNGMDTAAQNASGSADTLTASVNGISKKVSFDAVINGIGKITSGLENAAKKAVSLGTALVEEVLDRAEWADDTATQAMVLGMSVEGYQRYRGVFDTIGDLAVSDWAKAKTKIQKAIYDPSEDQANALAALGVPTDVDGVVRGWEDVFWEVGDQLRKKVESGELTQDNADVFANALFGRGYGEFNPLFALGQDAFSAALEEQNIVSDDSVTKMAELNDAVVKLQNSYSALETEVLSGMAPALTALSESLDSLLGKLLDYMKTPEGQQMLQTLGDAVSGLFEDLTSIDPESIVSGLAGAFEQLTDGLQWLIDNKDTVIDSLKTIVAGWAGLKLAGGALQVLQLINGLKGLGLGGGAAGTGGAVTGGGGIASGLNLGTAVSTLGTKLAPLSELFGQIATVASMGWQTILDHTDTGFAITSGESVKDIAKTAVEEITTGLNNFNDWLTTPFKLADAVATEYVSPFFYNIGASIEDPSKIFGDNGPIPVTVTPETEDNAAESIVTQIGTLQVPARLVIQGLSGGGIRTPNIPMMHANGLSFVPWDGYPAILHKGEAVIPAREVENRSFTSNLYVDTMNMNNGADIEKLSKAISAHNRRILAGYGG